MFLSLQVLCILAFAAIRTTCFECGINITGYSAELTPLSVDVPSGSSVTLTCRTTPLVTFPQWYIDDEAFTADRLPVDFTANESSIRFAAEDDVEIFCFFRVILGGSVVNICSKPSSIAVEGPRGPTDYASCNDVKVSFFSNANNTLTIYIDGIKEHTDDCSVSVLLTDCAHSENRAEMSEPVNAENGLATITTDIRKFSEKSISVDVSAESCNLPCEPPHNYYFTAIKPTGKRHVPNGSYNGTLIADAFSEAAIDCNFRGNVLEYTICVQSGGSIDCFDNPCR
ncbi:hypothetical protein GBAR_LOCUS19766 [Geodia barretti]|uniref:Ig-like domain-containing protein n=1 Tax=Geodia barretti TaxID=519541 RepID=A0AA35ST70_GEOBA|nr:hypothetical protein GBAR_LOCUS19766 [Geodia barretti]